MGSRRSGSRRAYLIDAVRFGKLEPQEAEQQAAKLGLQPLASQPEPAAFDPMQEPFWSLPMALAWIICRDAEAVRFQWDSYRKECWDWRPTNSRLPDGRVMCWQLEQRPPAKTDFPSLLEYLCQSKHQLNGVDAKRELWRSLQAGEIQAYGVSLKKLHDKPIPARLWKNLDDRPGAVPTYGVKGSSDAYRDVRVESAAVLGRWPANSAEIKEAKAARGRYAKEAALKALEALWPDGSIPAVNAKARNDAIKEWCKSNGHHPPGDRTINRAIKTFRAK